MEEENITSDPITDDLDVESADGEDEAVSEDVTEEKDTAEIADLSLEDINKTLGKDFPSKEAALKSIKDTYSYVGKKKEKIAEEVKPSPDNFVTKDQYEADVFFAQNSDLSDVRSIIEAKAKAEGVSVKEAAKAEDITKVIEAVKSQSESQEAKNVLESNSRISDKDSDYQKDFATAQATGDWSEFLAKHKGIGGDE